MTLPNDAPSAPVAAYGPPANSLGRTSAILAIVAVVVGLASQGLSVFAPLLQRATGSGVASISGMFSAFTIVHTLLSLAALIVGLVALRRRDLPQFAAGIGVGIGGAGVLSGIVALAVVPAIIRLFL